MTPEQLLAREAIAHTQSVYNTEGDRGRLDELLETFTEDGVLELDRGAYTGREAIRGALSPAVDAKKAEVGAPGGPRIFLRHNLTTRRIEFRSGTEADAWTYFFVMTPIGLDHCGVYVDRFVARDGRWLIARRRVKIDWAADTSTILAAPSGDQ
jgi:SnoaL-like domain